MYPQANPNCIRKGVTTAVTFDKPLNSGVVA